MASASLKRFVTTSPVGRLLLVPLRLKVVAPYLTPTLGAAARWLVASREHTNFTYDLTPANLRYLASFVAAATGEPVARVERFIEEIEGDDALRAHVARCAREAARSAIVDPEGRYGRRVGWYAFVRALKPRLVVETGVDKGLGACVICAALLRNAAEGARGAYVGTDINPEAGALLKPPYGDFGRILYGDSIASLRNLEGPVDLFVNDSDHSADYEAREYETIAPKLSPGAVVLGDNAHVTEKLRDFALRTGRQFLYFQEKPRGHWYPGAGIGVAFRAGGAA